MPSGFDPEEAVRECLKAGGFLEAVWWRGRLEREGIRIRLEGKRVVVYRVYKDPNDPVSQAEFRQVRARLEREYGARCVAEIMTNSGQALSITFS